MSANKEKYKEQLRQTLNKYSPITEESLEKFFAQTRLRAIKKYEDILQIGQTARKMYFVCEGIFGSLFLTPDGTPHIKNFFLTNYFAASTVSLLQNSPSCFGIQCLEAGLVLEVDYTHYRHLIDTCADIKDFYIAYVEHSWIIVNEKRQIAFATQTSAERYAAFLETYPDLDKRVPQHYIASYLGITPTQLSRLRRDLQ